MTTTITNGREESTQTSRTPTPRELCHEYPILETLLAGANEWPRPEWIAELLDGLTCEQNNLIKILASLCNDLDREELYSVLFALRAQVV
jgi:hypothetical protein